MGRRLRSSGFREKVLSSSIQYSGRAVSSRMTRSGQMRDAKTVGAPAYLSPDETLDRREGS